MGRRGDPFVAAQDMWNHVPSPLLLFIFQIGSCTFCPGRLQTTIFYLLVYPVLTDRKSFSRRVMRGELPFKGIIKI
jgi:hypothetical protein